MRSFLQPFFYSVFSVIVAAAALFLVLVAQYVFGLQPCPLCLYQRVPYFAVLVLGLAAAVGSKGHSIKILLVLMVLWATSVMVSGYHMGVEAGFWTFAACTSPSQGAESLAELEAMIHQAIVTPCDRPAFLWMGLSMADMNLLLSLVMLGCGLWVFKKTKKAIKAKG